MTSLAGFLPTRGRRALPLLGAFAALSGTAALPSPASAAEDWLHDSLYRLQATKPIECGSGDVSIPGETDQLHNVVPEIEYAAAYFDPNVAPVVGDTVYVRVLEYVPGGDQCLVDAGGTHASIEIKPPAGTHIDPAVPFLCGFGTQPAAQCPVVQKPVADGGIELLDGRSGGGAVWASPDGMNKFRIVVPLHLDAPLDSFSTTQERFCDGFCPEDVVPGRVQFVVRFQPGDGATWSDPLVTSVGLRAVAAGAPAGGGMTGSGGGTSGGSESGAPGSGVATTPGTDVATSLFAAAPPKTITRAALARGLAVRIAAAQGARVTVRLTAGGRLVAKASMTAGAGGGATVRLRPRKATLRTLRARRTKLHLTAGVRAAGVAATTSEARTLTLVR